jgi:hypothetical protein
VPNVYKGPYCPLNETLDLNYFSLSTSYDPNLTPAELQQRILPFWTVNGRMMKDHMSTNGVAYVIWMPVHDIKQLDIYQKDPLNPLAPILSFDVTPTASTDPMTVNAFILGKSDYCWIFRYRVPNIEWRGSPDHALCFETTQANRPIRPAELGGWLPSIQGTNATSLSEFMDFLKQTPDQWV